MSASVEVVFGHLVGRHSFLGADGYPEVTGFLPQENAKLDVLYGKGQVYYPLGVAFF